jgi:putative DNA primase/helicase
MGKYLKIKPKNIPSKIKKIDQWVCWKFELKSDDEKPRKMPYSAKNGYHGTWKESSSWSTFKYALKRSLFYDGIGFVVTKKDPYTAWDLDDCRDPKTGKINRLGRAVIEELNSYTEISPSGTGLRILVKAKLKYRGRRVKDTEAYDCNRYVTLTGNHLEGTPKAILTRQKGTEFVHRNLITSRMKTNNNLHGKFVADAKDRFFLKKALGLSDKDFIHALFSIH